MDVDAALKALAGAGVVAFGGVGLMSRVLPETEAFRTLAAMAGGRWRAIRRR